MARIPALYMTMIETAEIVAERYDVSREAQDEYALRSQQRTAAAQQAGRFDDEIVPLPSVMLVTDRNTGETSQEAGDARTRTRATARTPRSTASPALKPVFKDGQRVKEGNFITAGNASQLSDGASAAVLMEEKRGRAPRARSRSASIAASRSPAARRTRWASARSSRCRSCSQQHGLKIDDIDLWELNEAFACQVLYCRDRLGIPHDKLNVNGGAISIGHPYGMSGARMVGHALIEGKRRGAKLRRLHDVRRRRHGRGRAVRGRIGRDRVLARIACTALAVGCWRRAISSAGCCCRPAR